MTRQFEAWMFIVDLITAPSPLRSFLAFVMLGALCGSTVLLVPSPAAPACYKAYVLVIALAGAVAATTEASANGDVGQPAQSADRAAAAWRFAWGTLFLACILALAVALWTLA